MVLATWSLRALVALGAALAVLLVLAVLPLPARTAWLLAGVIVLVCGGLVVWHGHSLARVQKSCSEALMALGSQVLDLPPALRDRTPLIVVLGDGLDHVFAADARKPDIIVSDGAIWLRLDDANELRTLMLALRAWRGGRPPEGILIALAPALHPNERALVTSLSEIRAAVNDASRALGSTIPCFIAIYQRLSSAMIAVHDRPIWYGLAATEPFSPDISFEPLMMHAEEAAYGACGTQALAQTAACLSAAVEWSNEVVLRTLTARHRPTAPCALFGVGWVDWGPASEPDSPFGLWLTKRTGLTPPLHPASAEPWPLPQPIVAAAVEREWPAFGSRTLAYTVSLVALFLALAFVASAHNNRLLLDRINADLVRFNGADDPGVRRTLLATIKADRDELDRYQRLGIPLRLDFGLYRGSALAEPLMRAIASYREAPATIALDSLSLFDQGSAVLRPDSTRALVSALDLIKAHPDQHALIAGYTDNVGQAATNLRLSLQRAEAVRDWLVAASSLPATHFAVEGKGDAKPVADNQTAEGRARNRRVEITLMPPSRQPGQPTSSPTPADESAFQQGDT